ncbi:hypothetical protein M5D96_003168 [Drosophila gunungcola]|uniref:Uncharacterized protein n=1 Tax=Drosophila gunungcola TaxID=103775 RepID=A0A9P9YSB3_9MUSC|nr:hypothetical protein M5D96_003168 [Drosophila gunungcola]
MTSGPTTTLRSGPVRSWFLVLGSWLNLGYRHTRHAVDEVGKPNPRTEEGRRNQRSGSSELK